MVEGLYAIAGLLSLTNGLAVLLVNPRRVLNQVYLFGAVIACAWFVAFSRAISIGRHSPPYVVNYDVLFWIRMASFVPSFLIWQMSLMQVSLVHETSSLFAALKKTWLWLIVSTLLACLTLSEAFIPSYSTPAMKLRGPGYSLFLISIFCCGACILGNSIRWIKLVEGTKKLELKLFVSHAGLASLLAIGSSACAHFFPRFSTIRLTGPLWVLIWQGSIIWVLVHYRVFEGKQVMASVGQRIILLGLSVLLAVAIAHTIGAEGSMVTLTAIIAAISAGCIVLLCDQPLRRYLSLDARQILSAPRATVTNWARQGLDEEELKLRMQALLREWNKTDRVVLFARNDIAFQNLRLEDGWPGMAITTREGWITPEALQRQRKLPGTEECMDFLRRERLGALLAVPKGSPTPSLFVALGRKHSLRPYTYPDIQILLELAELMDNILTHSRVASRMAQIEKMETAAMMSRGLAHDLNNLATPVSSFLLHMEPRVRPHTPEAEVLQDAKHAVRVMQDYIRESLFFTRRLTPDFRPTTSREILDSVVKLTQPRAAARAVTVTQSESPSIDFIADDVLIKRLLQNLVFNGIDASPRGGTVTLNASESDTGVVQFHVIDHGAGVAPEIADRIFEPYFTTKDTGNDVRGVGLGLAICRKICDLHGGNIVVHSSGSGSRFTVTLPAMPGRETADQSRGSASACKAPPSALLVQPSAP